jgi:mono/diheme cytochrome c family protein
MTSGQRTRCAWAFVLGSGLAACGGGGSGASEEVHADESVGGEASQYEGPIASTDAAHGKEVFDDLCGDCHPDGGEDVGPSLIEDPHSPSRLRQQVREGSGKMRPFSEKRLPADDLEAVLAWLASVNAVK